MLQPPNHSSEPNTPNRTAARGRPAKNSARKKELSIMVEKITDLMQLLHEGVTIHDFRLSVVVTMTQDAARALAESNPENRKIDMSGVENFVRKMEKGVYTVEPSIEIDEQGRVINGMHRAYAHSIIDVPIMQTLVFGCSPESFKSHDRTMRVRSTKDALGIPKLVGEVTRLAAYILFNKCDDFLIEEMSAYYVKVHEMLEGTGEGFSNTCVRLAICTLLLEFKRDPEATNYILYSYSGANGRHDKKLSPAVTELKKLYDSDKLLFRRQGGRREAFRGALIAYKAFHPANRKVKNIDIDYDRMEIETKFKALLSKIPISDEYKKVVAKTRELMKEHKSGNRNGKLPF